MKIGGLQWDDENIEHIDEHGINPSEIADVCFGKHLAFPGRYGRYLIYGKTSQKNSEKMTGENIKI